MVNGPVSFSGLVSGLNTQSIISAEMAVYEQPLNNLQTEQSTINTKITDYQAINTQLLSLQQAADALADPAAFNEAYAAASSNSSIATASVSSGTQTGSLTFAVDQLAEGSTQISAGTVASPNDIVTSGRSSSAPAAPHSALPPWMRAPAWPRATTPSPSPSRLPVRPCRAARPVAASTMIGASNDQLDVAIDGTAQSCHARRRHIHAQPIGPGRRGGLRRQPHGVGRGVRGSCPLRRPNRDRLRPCRSPEDRLSPHWASRPVRPWPVPTASITVDGTSTTVSDIAGSGTTSVVLSSGTGGTVTVGITGGLSAGSMTAANISVGGGSLSSVVSAINNAGVGVTANALQVGSNSYALELTSNGTGTASSTTLDAQAFAGSGLGALLTTTAAQNAEVSVGGTGGYQVSSQSNSLSGLLPGITINLVSVSATPVTITVSPDGSTVADNVQALVSAANQLLSTISTDTAFNTPDQDGGPPQRGSIAQRFGPAGAGRGRRGRGDVGRRLGRDGGGVRRLGHHEPGNGDVQPGRVRDGLCEEPVCRPGYVHRGRHLRGGAAGLRGAGLRGRGQRQHVARELCGLGQPVSATGRGRRLVDLGLARASRCPRPRPTR